MSSEVETSPRLRAIPRAYAFSLVVMSSGVETSPSSAIAARIDKPYSALWGRCVRAIVRDRRLARATPFHNALQGLSLRAMLAENPGRTARRPMRAAGDIVLGAEALACRNDRRN